MGCYSEPLNAALQVEISPDLIQSVIYIMDCYSEPYPVHIALCYSFKAIRYCT